MNLQEIYNTVLFGIRAQGGPSIKNGACAYRGENGQKCAAGLLISDEHYRAEFENLRVQSFYVQKALANSLGIAINDLSGPPLVFIRRLQIIHDEIYDSSPKIYFFVMWEAKMEALADEYTLEYTAP